MLDFKKILLGVLVCSIVLFILHNPAYAQLNSITPRMTFTSTNATEVTNPLVTLTSTLLQSSIKSLPDSSFKSPAYESRKILLDNITSIIDQIKDNQPNSAIATLQHIKAIVVELITDPETRPNIIHIIDDVIKALGGSASPTPLSHTDITDSNGNIHRHFSNFTDFETHEDLTIDAVKAMRIMRITQLNDTIQSLPDSSFTNPVIGRSILRDNVTTLNNEIQKDEFHFAISELQGIKQELLGIAPYNSALLMDTNAQEKIIPMIDGIIHTTTLAAEPSDSIYQDVSPPLSPKGSSVLWFYIIVLIIICVVLGALVYKFSVRRKVND